MSSSTSSLQNKSTAGIVICGGKSTRMGTDKASLIFEGRSMLDRVTSVMAQCFDVVVVVAAQNQRLPELNTTVRVVHDEASNRGPLEGIRVGLKYLPENVEAAFVTGCDVPLLRAEFVQLIVDQLGDHEIAIAESEGFKHPLAGVYRKTVLKEIELLLNEDRLRPFFLFEQVKTQVVAQSILEAVDPELHSLLNLNSPEDLEKAKTALRMFPNT